MKENVYNVHIFLNLQENILIKKNLFLLTGKPNNNLTCNLVEIYNHELNHSVKDALNLKGLTEVELVNTKSTSY
jgi:hypothetical protein